jgi:UDP-N-acetyl-D-glucosamine dehydrogenase
MLSVSVVGQGYVGLPLAVAASNAGYMVTGIDLEEEKISLLKSGVSYIEDVTNSDIQQILKDGTYRASSNFDSISRSSIILICVPTPLSIDGKPDLTSLENAVRSVAKNMTPGSLVIIESTVEPGTTRNFVAPIIEQVSQLNSLEYYLAFSPERIDPKNKTWNVKNTPKLVAGLNKESMVKTLNFYSTFVDSIFTCDSPEVAETAKLLENSFRLINISFINEIAMFCRELGIEVSSVIDAAKTKPYGFMEFHPSIGAGGHCIPVDPVYLSQKAKKMGVPSRMIDLASKINSEVPLYYVDQAYKRLGDLKGKKILVIGVSYKANVADVRETPVSNLIQGLRQKGAKVFWHDELVKEWNDEQSTPLGFDFDLAILATPHDYLDLSKLGSLPIINTHRSM